MAIADKIDALIRRFWRAGSISNPRVCSWEALCKALVVWRVGVSERSGISIPVCFRRWLGSLTMMRISYGLKFLKGNMGGWNNGSWVWRSIL